MNAEFLAWLKQKIQLHIPVIDGRHRPTDPSPVTGFRLIWRRRPFAARGRTAVVTTYQTRIDYEAVVGSTGRWKRLSRMCKLNSARPAPTGAISEQERKGQRYVDDPRVADPSVITLNVLPAAQAANDLAMLFAGLLAEEAALLHQMNFARERFDCPVGKSEVPSSNTSLLVGWS